MPALWYAKLSNQSHKWGLQKSENKQFGLFFSCNIYGPKLVILLLLCNVKSCGGQALTFPNHTQSQIIAWGQNKFIYFPWASEWFDNYKTKKQKCPITPCNNCSIM